MRRRLRDAPQSRRVAERAQLPESIPLVVDPLPVDGHPQRSRGVSDSSGTMIRRNRLAARVRSPSRRTIAPYIRCGTAPLNQIFHSRLVLGQTQIGDEGNADAGRHVVRDHPPPVDLQDDVGSHSVQPQDHLRELPDVVRGRVPDEGVGAYLLDSGGIASGQGMVQWVMSTRSDPDTG